MQNIECIIESIHSAFDILHSAFPFRRLVVNPISSPRACELHDAG
jgi:hypothetical protein